MDVWDYDRKTGALLGRSTARPSPEEPGAWLIPAYATSIRPPFVPEGCVAIFNGGLSAVGEWRIELDEGRVCGVGSKETAPLFAIVDAIIEHREDRDNARGEIVRAAEAVLDRDLPAADQKAVRDEAKLLVRALIYGKSMN